MEGRQGCNQKLTLAKMLPFQSVANASEDKLCTLSGDSLQEIQYLQLTCQRYLDDRTKALEAMDLLKLVAQSRGEHASGDGHKRQRTDC